MRPSDFTSRPMRFFWILLSSSLVLGCSMAPQPRLESYLGPFPQEKQVSGPVVPSGHTLAAGLVVINDTGDPESAPALSPQALAFLTDRVRQQIEHSVPVQVVKVLSPVGVAPEPNTSQFVRLGQQEGVEYLVLAIFSSAEREVAAKLPLTGDPEQGGGRPFVTGYEALNFALAELALIDAKTGLPMVQAQGRAWSRLNRLYVPIKSNAYPVIHRSLRVAPIYPKEENAKDVLRSIAGDEALEQALMHLQEAWRVKPAA